MSGMRRRRYEFHPSPPTFRQRIAAAFLLALLVAVLANDLAGWGAFGGYDRQVCAVSVLVGSILMAWFLPGVRKVGDRS